MTMPNKLNNFHSLFKNKLPDNHSVIVLVAIGFLAGFLWTAAMRFFLINPPQTHYHANFAVFINGQREEFKEFTYYEEVAACTTEYDSNPKGRVHMHGKINYVIHVHDERVTFGDFFSNIGWTVGDDVLGVTDKVLVDDEKNKLFYILNGKEVDRIDNRVIGNRDRLLVSYGSTLDEAQRQFETVASSAIEVNKYQDPASCGGLNGPGHDSIMNRMKRSTFWQ